MDCSKDFLEQSFFFIKVFDIIICMNNVNIKVLAQDGAIIPEYKTKGAAGADGVQGHTKTLWRLLKLYEIPVFIFINKMDQMGTDSDKLLDELKTKLDDNCIAFNQILSDDFYEQIMEISESLGYIRNIAIL